MSAKLYSTKWSICISKSQKNYVRIIFWNEFCVVYIPFVRMNKSKILVQLPVDPLPLPLSLVMYSFSVNVQHSLIIWLIVSSLSPHNLNLLFYHVFYILSFIYLVLMVLFCAAAIRRESLPFAIFPIFSHVQILTCEISLVFRLKCPYCFFSSHFFFTGYFCSGNSCVCIVFGACDQSPCVFLCRPLVVVSIHPRLSSMLASRLPPFLNSYRLSTSSLGRKVIWMVNIFLVNWSICWSSSLVLSKNDPEYLPKDTFQVFIPFMKF